ncbi:lasso RiPP family leader peptide-containing protein [Streptomyces sp. NPDC014734]
MDTHFEFETVTYTAPVLSELGSVTEATLGSAGNNNADDTQYWQ